MRIGLWLCELCGLCEKKVASQFIPGAPGGALVYNLI